jgi:hypothetical protein
VHRQRLFQGHDHALAGLDDGVDPIGRPAVRP